MLATTRSVRSCTLIRKPRFATAPGTIAASAGTGLRVVTAMSGGCSASTTCPGFVRLDRAVRMLTPSNDFFIFFKLGANAFIYLF
jgi:hypothetical protein